MEIQYSLEEINTVAAKVLDATSNKIILFHGQMGAGKTTFIKSLARKLGVKDTTGSPTFSLVNEYQTADGEAIYHFDMYRLNAETEAYDMGMDEYLYSGNWCFIEWAEKIPNLIPEKHSTIILKVSLDGKRILSLR